MAERGALMACLLLASIALSSALDCSSIPGCQACELQNNRRGNAKLVCSRCAAPAYKRTNNGACYCAPGYAGRELMDPEPLGSCRPCGASGISSGGPINGTSCRTCPAGAQPSPKKNQCLCKPGHYVAGLAMVAVGTVPLSCTLCPDGSIQPNATTAPGCRPCAPNKIATANRTACVSRTAANSGINAVLSGLASSFNQSIANALPGLPTAPAASTGGSTASNGLANLFKLPTLPSVPPLPSLLPQLKLPPLPSFGLPSVGTASSPSTKGGDEYEEDFPSLVRPDLIASLLAADDPDF